MGFVDAWRVRYSEPDGCGDNAVQSTAGKLGLVLRSVAQFIFGREFPALAVVVAILLLTASWLLLRHQQVEN